MLPHDEVVRRYGPWAARTPADAVDLLVDYPGRWWIAGGWAVEAFTGVPRQHGDLDPSIPRSDVAELVRHVAGQLDVWQADRGILRPVLSPDERLSPSCSNLWLRAGGAEPWEYDVILMDLTDATWTYKRDRRINLPVDDLFWTQGGVTYLRPEIQLLHKAPGLRPKDEADFRTCLPLLAPERRGWLRDALATAHPGHPWLERL
ncbi:hypothetical protein [Angustibacter sp. Root456]|uniref:nucleotidyltransferase domain-containing protein n=1 Tax=Angustibacter sp. Root456 TaxID=1736539 RepID=UPI0019105EBB|nr:hypothetical protein [Angustibacter sp. Root456]